MGQAEQHSESEPGKRVCSAHADEAGLGSTYQDSEFGWRCFDNGGRPMNPTVVLWPDRRKSKIRCPSGMQVFSQPRDAVGFARLA